MSEDSDEIDDVISSSGRLSQVQAVKLRMPAIVIPLKPMKTTAVVRRKRPRRFK